MIFLIMFLFLLVLLYLYVCSGEFGEAIRSACVQQVLAEEQSLLAQLLKHSVNVIFCHVLAYDSRLLLLEATNELFSAPDSNHGSLGHFREN